MKTHYSNGKLLITAEYLVLDGAISLALPTKYGQSLQVLEETKEVITWKSYDHEEQLWFTVRFSLPDLKILDTADHDKALTLQKILQSAIALNPTFLKEAKGFSVSTHLTFPREWGLGTSSTLINNIAQWANVNAFTLLHNSFGGSGYDIANAQNNTPITYQLKDKDPIVTPVSFNPPFKDQLYFVYLNKKQNSKEGIANYRQLSIDKTRAISEVNQITQQILQCTNVNTFKSLIRAHETLIATTVNLPTVQSIYFSDYSGVVKSLGAWGGDFVLAVGDKDTPAYFKERGFNTIIPFEKMIL